MDRQKTTGLHHWCAAAMTVAMTLSAAAQVDAQELPAFPGAEGFGSTTPGGRGGAVVAVTTLAGSGPGSFREALSAEGPRIIVFHVGGTILLDSPIYLQEPFVTIAGQTAPGDGVTVRGAHLNISSHDVIVRGLRFRVGDDPSGPTGANRDGLAIADGSDPPYNVVLDHCSVAWAIDENLSTWYACHDLTIQWCITAEALHDSLHDKGPHSMGFLVGDEADSVSIHHNLFAHNNGRNPLLKADTVVDVVNNLIYNWGGAATSHSNYEGTDLPIFANHIGNHYIPGVDSGTWEISIPENMPVDSEIYVEANIGPHRLDASADEWDVCSRTGEYLVEQRHDFAPVTTWSALDASVLVRAHAGATVPRRDAVDERIVQSVLEGTGQIIDSQSEVGGWPSFGGGEVPDDTDGDGLPDDWERQRGLDPDDAEDGAGASPDGYDWIEVYVNSLIPVPGNEAPVVSAGADLQILLGEGAQMTGSVTDDGIPVMPFPVRVQWSQQSGPADATIASSSELETDVTFPEAGTYVLSLSADDFELTTSDSVTITVSTTGEVDGGRADADQRPDGASSPDGDAASHSDGDKGCSCAEAAGGRSAPPSLLAALLSLFT